MSNHGTLIPEHYDNHQPTAEDIELSSIIWGLSLGATLYTFFTAAKQTFKAWRRARRVTVYMVLVWLEWASSTTMGAISWCFLKCSINPGLEYFMAIFVLWCFQVYTLMQIIINRIAILSVDRTTVFRVKWGTFALLFLINISVVCIWVPANLQISEKFVAINNIWDRIQKALICIIDAALNYYFVHLVRSRLIANGLTKYTRLYRYNLFMIVISIALDILIVAMMSLPNKLVYVQFHPLAYLLKLQIELSMAELIIKIVRATNPQVASSEPYPIYAGTTAQETAGQGFSGKKFPSWNNTRRSGGHNTTQTGVGDDDDTNEMEMYANAIKKTIVTEVVSSDAPTKKSSKTADDEDLISEDSVPVFQVVNLVENSLTCKLTIHPRNEELSKALIAATESAQPP